MSLRQLAAGAALAALAVPAFATVGIGAKLQWSYRHDVAGQGLGAEINAFDPGKSEIYVTGSEGVDVLSSGGVYLRTLRISANNDTVNNVAVKNGIVAMAGDVGAAGRVRFLDTDGNFIRDVVVGPTPDQATFTPDGKKLVVAIEAEGDAEGGIAIIDVATGAVNTLEFGGFAAQETALRAGGALFRPDKISFAADIEPEFVSITPDGSKAVVTLQENNMVATVDLATETIVSLTPLGLKDVTGAASFNTHRSSAATANSLGLTGATALFQPDGIATFENAGVGYMVLVNEGENLGNNRTIPLDASVPAATVAALDPANVTGQTFWHLDLNNDGTGDTIAYSGGRSVSIRLLDGTLVWDSGNSIEQAVLANGLLGANSSRLNALSIEPENLAIGDVWGQRFLFVGVERGLSIATFNITDPTNPVFTGLIFDLAQEDAFDEFEGLTFVSAAESWTGRPMLIASAEDEGWTHVFQLSVPEPGTWGMMIAGFGIVGASLRRRRQAHA